MKTLKNTAVNTWVQFFTRLSQINHFQPDWHFKAKDLSCRSLRLNATLAAAENPLRRRASRRAYSSFQLYLYARTRDKTGRKVDDHPLQTALILQEASRIYNALRHTRLTLKIHYNFYLRKPHSLWNNNRCFALRLQIAKRISNLEKDLKFLCQFIIYLNLIPDNVLVNFERFFSIFLTLCVSTIKSTFFSKRRSTLSLRRLVRWRQLFKIIK